MLELFLQNPSAVVVSLALLLCILIIAFGLCLLIRDMIESPWRKRCEDMIEAEKERRLRLELLGAMMAEHTLKCRKANEAEEVTSHLTVTN